MITSSPYWDILLERRTAGYKPIRHYGDEQNDLGKIADYDAFLNELAGVFRGCYQVLHPGGYCCIVVMDLLKRDGFSPSTRIWCIACSKRGISGMILSFGIAATNTTTYAH